MATEYKVNVINMDNIESYIAERDVKQRQEGGRRVKALNNYFTEWGFKKHCLQITEKKDV